MTTSYRNCFLLLFLFGIFQSKSPIFGQSVKKITIQHTLDPTLPASLRKIISSDIAYGGKANVNDPSYRKIIGYRFKNINSQSTIGLLNLDANGTQLFSQTYTNGINPGGVFEIVKINPAYDDNRLFVLTGLQPNSAISKAYPLLLVFDRFTGTLLSSYFFNNMPIPDLDFVPSDLLCVNDEKIMILGIGRTVNAVAPNPKSSIYLVEFNLTANTFSTTRVTNQANLSGMHEYPMNFIRSHHFGTLMYSDLSFYGLELNPASSNITRGLVFNQVGATQTCKAFTFNNVSTRCIQVNTIYDTEQTIAIQNNSDDIYMEQNMYFQPPLWQKKYTKNFSAPFRLTGLSHGMKGINAIDSRNYFIGQYQMPGFGASGYSFFRYDNNTGNLFPSYNYDLNTDIDVWFGNFSGHSRSFSSDYSSTGHFIGNCKPMTSQAFQYFYTIDNDIYENQPPCTNNLTFSENSHPILKQDVLLTFAVLSTNQSPNTTPVISFSSNSPVIETICPDFEGRLQEPTDPEKRWELDPTLDGMLTPYDPESGEISGKQGGRITDNGEFIKVSVVNGNRLVLNTSEPNLKQVNIYTTSGQLVEKIRAFGNSHTTEVGVKNLIKGHMYLLEFVFNNGKIKSNKIVF